MYLYPLDKASNISLANRSNFNLFSIEDKISRSGLIQNILCENLINKKTSIVLVPNLEQAQYIKQCLASANLDQLCMIINDNKAIGDRDLATLRSNAKRVTDNKKIIEYEILKANADKATDDLKNSYELLNKKIFGDRSWRVLSAQKEYFQYHKEVNLVKRKIDLNQIEFTQKEYWNIRGRIEEASNTYVNKFSILQKIDGLKPSLYEDDHLNDKLIKLEKLVNKGNNLLLSFGDLIEQISQEFKNHGLEEFEQLSAMNAAVIHSLNEYEKRNETKVSDLGFQHKLKNVFAKKVTANDINSLRQQIRFLYGEFSESQFFNLNMEAPDFDELNIISIKDITALADTVLSNWQTSLESYKQIKLKQMSPLNSEYHELNNLDKALSAFLTEINNAEILDKRVEDNTFSLYKKIDLLEATLDQLNTGFSILAENEDYIEWKRMLAYCKTGTKSIIQALVGLPLNHWTRIFDQIFIGDLLDRNLSPKLPKNELQLKHIDEVGKKCRALSNDAIICKWNIRKNEQLDLLKKENKQLHTTIVKKNSPIELSWPNLVTQSPDTICALFPIIIVTEASASKIKPLYYKWSECISFDWSGLQDPGLLQIKGFSLRQTVLEANDISETLVRRLKSYFNTNHIEAKALIGDNLGPVSQPLHQMQNADKLRAAKVMTKQVLGINPNVRLFYLKNTSLISSLSDKDNSRLVESLSQYGMKEVGQIYKLDETMLDMFVDTSKKLILLTEDGLINTSDIENFDWQYQTLKNLKTLGCNVINMWTADNQDGQAQLLETIDPSQKAPDLFSQTDELTLSLQEA